MACTILHLIESMAEHNEIGNTGEEIALDYLTDRGYNILETNWRFGKEEIDIIAINADFLIIVEVKTRTSDKFGDPSNFVNYHKQKMLIRAAQIYSQRFGITQEIRFDIISILLDNNKPKITHLVDAFFPV